MECSPQTLEMFQGNTFLRISFDPCLQRGGARKKKFHISSVMRLTASCAGLLEPCETGFLFQSSNRFVTGQ